MGTIEIILIGVIVLIVIGMVMALSLSQENARKQRIMMAVKGHHKTDSKNDKTDTNKRRDQIAKSLKENKDPDKADKKKKTISAMLGMAGLEISTGQFWMMSAVSMVVFVGAAKVMGYGVGILLPVAIIGLLGFPRFVLKWMIGKRQKDFLSEFPDALEATVRLLKAGMPVSEAVMMIAKEFEGPVGEEMSRIYDRQKIGVPLHEAALDATKRMPLPEMQMFATGLAIQAQTGASLSEVLLNLSGVIRARFKLKRKVKALSSEAIASAGIIAALPILVSTGMYFLNYDYIMTLWRDPFGNVLLAGCVIWALVGVFVMKAMINFKV